MACTEAIDEIDEMYTKIKSALSTYGISMEEARLDQSFNFAKLTAFILLKEFQWRTTTPFDHFVKDVKINTPVEFTREHEVMNKHDVLVKKEVPYNVLLIEIGDYYQLFIQHVYSGNANLIKMKISSCSLENPEFADVIRHLRLELSDSEDFNTCGCAFNHSI